MIKFSDIIKEEIVPSEIEGLEGKSGVISYLDDLGIDYREESINGNSVLIVGKKQHVVEFEGEFPVPHTLEEFLREKSSTRYFSEFTGVDWRKQYTKQFWENVGTINSFNELYHATEEQYVDDILENGLEARNQTRIPTSKIRRDAVFAVKNTRSLADGAYGSKLLAIDTLGMKKDGVTPRVGREKDWERQDRAMFLKDKLNLYGEIRTIVPAGEGGTGSWSGTVVIYSDIPPKYVSLMQ